MITTMPFPMASSAKALAAAALLALSPAPLLGAPPAAARNADQTAVRHQPTTLPAANPCPSRGTQSAGQAPRAKTAKGGRGSKDAHGYGDAHRAARDLQAEVARVTAELGCDEVPGDHGARGMWDTIDGEADEKADDGPA